MENIGEEVLKKDLTKQNQSSSELNNTDETEQFLRKNLLDTPDRSPEDVKSELMEKRGTKDLRENTSSASPEDTRSEILNKKTEEKREEEIKKLVDEGLKKQAAKDLEMRKEREAILASQGINSVDVQKKGKEIDRDDLILPRSLTNSYNEQNGKFFAKESSRLMFEDKGEKIATSTTNKQAIADMVTYAKAKQWESIKLTGSKEFRREAWLQAESQGVKTQGYTPQDKDLAELKQLTAERQTNAITPVAEREQKKQGQGQEQGQEVRENAAPRHDLNKNQAVIHTEATKSINENMKQLQETRKFEGLDTKELSRLAYWRGVVIEENKMLTKPDRDESLAKFDKLAESPDFLKKLETVTTTQEKTVERERSITQETGLSR